MAFRNARRALRAAALIILLDEGLRAFSVSCTLRPRMGQSWATPLPQREEDASPPRTLQRAFSRQGAIPVAEAAAAGAIAAFVQAMLFAVTEPILNRVGVQRKTLREAMRQVDPEMMRKHFKTTLPTSLVKQPLNEGLLAVLRATGWSDGMQGLMLGILYPTLTLPLTNFRLRRSLGQKFKFTDLYAAYLPTLVRDIVGAQARTRVNSFCALTLGWARQSPSAMALSMFLTCVISSPFNELRMFYLKREEMTWKEFFQPKRCLRSTVVGACNFGLALFAGYWLVPLIAK
ncbi:unnamed protein product, partial [Symbiodinium pilosum]